MQFGQRDFFLCDLPWIFLNFLQIQIKTCGTPVYNPSYRCTMRFAKGRETKYFAKGVSCHKAKDNIRKDIRRRNFNFMFILRILYLEFQKYRRKWAF